MIRWLERNTSNLSPEVLAELGIGYARLNRQGRVVDANAVAEKLTGLSQSELAGVSVFDLYLPIVESRLHDAFLMVRAQSVGATVHEFFPHLNTWFDVRLTPVDGDVIVLFQDTAAPPTILVAEDEPQVRMLVHRILETRGYRVLQAKSGVDAVEVWELYPEQIDLVITDVVMPQMGGSALAQELCTRQPGLKVLFMSGYTEDAVVQHGIRTNGINFLEKPFSPTALLSKTREILFDDEAVTA